MSKKNRIFLLQKLKWIASLFFHLLETEYNFWIFPYMYEKSFWFLILI